MGKSFNMATFTSLYLNILISPFRQLEIISRFHLMTRQNQIKKCSFKIIFFRTLQK